MSSMPKAPAQVLLSGFEPFGGFTHNPSQDLVAEMAHRAAHHQLTAQQEHGQVSLHTVDLPVEFGRAGDQLISAVENSVPDVVVSVGLAAGIDAVRLERVGLNLRDARIPDNKGSQPLDQPVLPGGAAAHFSTLRLKAARERIAAAAIPVSLSLSAGSYLCNEVLYTLLHHISATERETAAGFVHIPDLRSPESPVSLAQAADALDLLITESLLEGPDAAAAAGALH